MTGFTVSTRDEGGCAVLVVVGELDCGTVDELRAAMHKLFRRGRVRLVVDLSEVPFCDSSGLGVLVGCFKRTRACGGSFRVAGVAPNLLKTLTITGLAKVFPIHSNIVEAVEADKAASSCEVVGL